MPKTSNQKAIISGDIVEFYRYEDSYGYDLYSDQKKSKTLSTEDENKTESEESIKKRSMQRTKKNLRRLISANCYQWKDEEGGVIKPKFVTLTFRENMTDVEKANKHLTNFIKRLNYKVFETKKSKLEYTAVIEFQKRGAVHYHVVFYNLKWIKKTDLMSVWSHGFVKINEIDHVDNIGAYVSKYLTKESLNNDRLNNKKRYFSSRGLLRPVQVRDSTSVSYLRYLLSSVDPEFVNTFSNTYLGTTEYEIINISKFPKLKESLKLWLNV